MREGAAEIELPKVKNTVLVGRHIGYASWCVGGRRPGRWQKQTHRTTPALTILAGFGEALGTLHIWIGAKKPGKTPLAPFWGIGFETFPGTVACGRGLEPIWRTICPES
ncbi:hypothetical protein JKF63_02187 [Porcisia hertigi]|uniref:Uncharacterized protein n=1 Tax=Porcisia hertigi TaxID=2761500 RepID=A0A836HLU2_9TRYP|nr:hypothetical protein JKF63_02187 [Porcisia hertigi]